MDLLIHNDLLDVYCGDVRDTKGRFRKGRHWRRPQAFRDSSWLRSEYVVKQRSAADIAAEFKVGTTAIYFWLQRHGIARRTTSEVRSIKHWGSDGEQNPMFGRYGERNPNWKGGLTPLRQRLYARHEWRSFARRIRKRDKVCQLCGEGKYTQIHHIERFASAPLLFMDEANVILLCGKCHRRIRGRENWWRKRFYKLLAERGVR